MRPADKVAAVVSVMGIVLAGTVLVAACTTQPAQSEASQPAQMRLIAETPNCSVHGTSQPVNNAVVFVVESKNATNCDIAIRAW